MGGALTMNVVSTTYATTKTAKEEKSGGNTQRLLSNKNPEDTYAKQEKANKVATSRCI
jgi:hypothetical protein